jgi:hypothetical protein
MTADTLFALIVAFLINFTVVSCFAELFYDSGELLNSDYLSCPTPCTLSTSNLFRLSSGRR